MISKAKPFALTICLTVIIGMLPAGVRTLAQQTVQSRTVRPAGVSGQTPRRISGPADGGQWQTVFEGRGELGRSGASFNPVRARFVRITAIAERDTQHWWSIYRLKISG